MKKKGLKVLSLILVLLLLTSVFALTACTDDDDEPRVLDSVEQSIVGTWQNTYKGTVATGYDTRTYNSDGTYEIYDGDDGSLRNKGTFKHNGGGVDGEFGHYEIIREYIANGSAVGATYALFDIYPDKLYGINSDGTVGKSYPMERQY